MNVFRTPTLYLQQLVGVRISPQPTVLAAPVQAADNGILSTQACLQLIKDYWTGYEASGVEPAHIFNKFDAQCESTKELDNLMLNDKDINDITARLAKKGII